MDIYASKRKKALMLHYAGERVYEIYSTLSTPVHNATPVPDGGEQREAAVAVDEYEQAKTQLKAHFEPSKNTEYEEYVFRRAKQTADETLDSYAVRLRVLAQNCEFPDVDKAIKSHIIQSCTSTRLRRKGLRDYDMSLTQLLDFGRSLETSEAQAKEIESGPEANRKQANAIHKKMPRRWNGKPPKENKLRTGIKATPCRNCGGKYPHKQGRESCPAFGQKCLSCGKMNHYARCCLSTKDNKKKKVHYVEDKEKGSSSDDDYVFAVNKQTSSKQPTTTVTIGKTRVTVLIDSGASVNIMDERTYNTLHPKPTLHKDKTQIFTYASSTTLPIIGAFVSEVESKHKIVPESKFFVYRGRGHNSLLSYQTATELGLIEIINAVYPPDVRHITVADRLRQEYPEVFNGIGKLQNYQLKLHIDPTIPPRTQPHRRIPFHVRRQVESELQYLEQQDIIEKIDGPTPWVSPLVVVPKPKNPNAVRICVDMRAANQAISRERHVTPTVDEIIHDLNGAQIFSKLDLKSGYHQIELHPASRHITTFATHVGLRRYKRLSFGISSAAEIFQHIIEQVLDGIPGTRNISDDIIVFGRTQKEHDASLKAVLQRLKEKGLTVSPEKCVFNKSTLHFYGHVFSKEGVSPDPKKIQAIHNATPPANPAEVRSLLGMASYCARFVPDFSTVTAPLRELTKTDVDWTWRTPQQTALEELKKRMTSDAVIAYFDPSKKTEVVVDASPVGLGAVLVQKHKEESKVVAYASRSLTNTERRYSQFERETLAAAWGCEHFNLYLYGHPFTLVTDHKPLKQTWDNPRSKPSARIERWILRLQKYDFIMVHRPGPSNPADYMSRHPAPTENNSVPAASAAAEEYVHYVTANAVPKAMTLTELQDATQADPTLQAAVKLDETNKWYAYQETAYADGADLQMLKELYKVRHELSYNDTDKILLHGTRIVVPAALQERAVILAHVGHQGIVKTKALLREKVWFPGINQRVETLVKNCITCQASEHPKMNKEPLIMTELPQGPWEEVSADFCGPLPATDKYLLVIVDDYSRYPVVEMVTSTSATAVVPVVDKVFAMFGTPKVLKTDNGPPFNSAKFKEFANYLGFTHRKVTPYWPKANGEAERMMRTLNKVLRAAHQEQIPCKQAISSFLRNYRATPHTTTGVTPAEALLGRKLSGQIPSARHSKMNDDSRMRAKDKQEKERMKRNADKHARGQTDLQIGDFVLVQQPKQNKLTTPYKPKPCEVVSVKGTMITARGSQGELVTRNRSHFSKLPGSVPHLTQHTGTESDELDDELPSKPQLRYPPARTPAGQEARYVPRPKPLNVVNPRKNPVRTRKKPAYLSDFVSQLHG